MLSRSILLAATTERNLPALRINRENRVIQHGALLLEREINLQRRRAIDHSRLNDLQRNLFQLSAQVIAQTRHDIARQIQPRTNFIGMRAVEGQKISPH